MNLCPRPMELKRKPIILCFFRVNILCFWHLCLSLFLNVSCLIFDSDYFFLNDYTILLAYAVHTKRPNWISTRLCLRMNVKFSNKNLCVFTHKNISISYDVKSTEVENWWMYMNLALFLPNFLFFFLFMFCSVIFLSMI